MKISDLKLDEAARLYSLGDDVSAKQIDCDLLKDDPKNIAFLNRYAVTCLNTGYYDLAIDACQRSLELAPRLPDSYFICGLAYYHWGDIVNSEKSFLKSLELNPSRRDIRDLWGKLKSQPYFSVSGGIQSTHSP
jgi:tetratricopeptide (TPR) repeat protein